MSFVSGKVILIDKTPTDIQLLVFKGLQYFVFSLAKHAETD